MSEQNYAAGYVDSEKRIVLAPEKMSCLRFLYDLHGPGYIFFSGAGREHGVNDRLEMERSFAMDEAALAAFPLSMKQAFSFLSDRTRDCLNIYYGFSDGKGKSDAETAAELGISAFRVRELLAEAYNDIFRNSSFYRKFFSLHHPTFFRGNIFWDVDARTNRINSHVLEEMQTREIYSALDYRDMAECGPLLQRVFDLQHITFAFSEPVYVQELKGKLIDEYADVLEKFDIRNMGSLVRCIKAYYWRKEDNHDRTLSPALKAVFQEYTDRDCRFFELAKKEFSLSTDPSWYPESSVELTLRSDNRTEKYSYSDRNEEKKREIAGQIYSSTAGNTCLQTMWEPIPLAVCETAVMMGFATTFDLYNHIEEVRDMCSRLHIPCSYQEVEDSEKEIIVHLFTEEEAEFLKKNNIKDVTEIPDNSVCSRLKQDALLYFENREKERLAEEEDERERQEARLVRMATYTEHVPKGLEVSDETSIEELELSVRSNNCLKRARVECIGDLINMTEGDLLQVRNLREKSLEEIKSKLAAYGLSLREGENSHKEES